VIVVDEIAFVKYKNHALQFRTCSQLNVSIIRNVQLK
jgi:hypothetical protein